MKDKPLFIPLRGEWFDQFAVGQKDTEYRAYGPRWNETTCPIGRHVTLSRGYSGPRLHGVVSGFERLAWRDAPDFARDIFPGAKEICAIQIDRIKEAA